MVVDPRIDRVEYGEEQPESCTFMEQYPPQEIYENYYDVIQKDTRYSNVENPKNNPMLASTTQSIKNYHANYRDVVICDSPDDGYVWGKKGEPIKMAIGSEECPWVAFPINIFLWVSHFTWTGIKFRIYPSLYIMCNGNPDYGALYYPVTLAQGQHNTNEWIINQTWTIEGVTENYGGHLISGQTMYLEDGYWVADSDTEPDSMCPGNVWNGFQPIIPAWDCAQEEDWCGIVGGTAGWVSGLNAKARAGKQLYYVTFNAVNSHPDPQGRLHEPPIGPPLVLKTDPEWEYYGRYDPARSVLYDKDIFWPFVECDGEYLGTYLEE